jgi:hypothetical protein
MGQWSWGQQAQPRIANGASGYPANPLSGDEKKGDLAGVFVYKFKPGALFLLAVGPYDNFYVALKR